MILPRFIGGKLFHSIDEHFPNMQLYLSHSIFHSIQYFIPLLNIPLEKVDLFGTSLT